jgi:hypothetical protein
VRIALDPFLERLVRELLTSAPDALGHIDPRRILFVSGAARLESRASIRPLTFGGSPPSYRSGKFEKPKISMGGTPMLYEICLRPRFFLDATPGERLLILAHELFHIAPAFDGTLAADRRHARAGTEQTEQIEQIEQIEQEVEAIAARVPLSEARAILAHEGELEMRAWLARPPSRIPLEAKIRKAYDDRDLYAAIVTQKIGKRGRAGS